MENRKHKELEILIAIRNNQAIPADEFYKLFDDRWPDYKESMGSLFTKGMFKLSTKLELTSAGKRRVTELLCERSGDLSNILLIRSKTKKLRTFPVRSPLTGIMDMVSYFSLRFKRQVH
jgi:hypothetical protein